MKTKQVWKLLMAVMLLMTTWGIGLVNASDEDPTVTIDAIKLWGGGFNVDNSTICCGRPPDRAIGAPIENPRTPRPEQMTPSDTILGTYDTGGQGYILANLKFFAINDEDQQVPIEVGYVQYANGTYSAGFDYETAFPPGYIIIGVDATFLSRNGNPPIMVHFQGYLNEGGGGQCHEGMCVPVGY